ncbi:MAG: hypothetical protein IJD83_00550 [Clostridia bacterium]|nr:hypothetical protein [Clostridia bacterium]
MYISDTETTRATESGCGCGRSLIGCGCGYTIVLILLSALFAVALGLIFGIVYAETLFTSLAIIIAAAVLFALLLIIFLLLRACFRRR